LTYAWIIIAELVHLFGTCSKATNNVSPSEIAAEIIVEMKKKEVQRLQEIVKRLQSTKEEQLQLILLEHKRHQEAFAVLSDQANFLKQV
jgi:hypothetical protein